ncbi:MAG: ATP synthase F1 subunit epsilon [Acidimicrobiia bacterium]
MNVEVVSPEEMLWQGEADMVVARTIEGGEIAFLRGHEPFLGALDIAPVRIILPESGEIAVAVHGGFVEVANDRVLVLSDVAELPEQIDVERAAEAKTRAEEVLQREPENPEALQALQRADVRLALVADQHGTPASH